METNNDVLQIILIVAVIVIGGVCYVLFNKKSEKASKSDLIEGADLLMTALPRAMDEKALEDPLLASAGQSQQAINRLHIAAVYLMITLTAIRHSNGAENYTSSQSFAHLLSEILPYLKQLYAKRGTKTERANELININFKRIKALLITYSKEVKVNNIDASLAVQAWFEELSHINLAGKPYLTNILLQLFDKDKEQSFIIALCQPKAYSLLVNKIRDNTEYFLRLSHPMDQETLQEQNGQIVSYNHFERYITSFLLILGITILKQAKGAESYLYASEYQAIRNKTIHMMKAMLLNSRKVGVQSIDDNQTKQIMTFMDKQLNSLQLVCQSYIKALNNIYAEANATDYLLEWLKQASPSNVNASKLVRDYIDSALNN